MKKLTLSIVDHHTYSWESTFANNLWPPSLCVPNQVLPLSSLIARFTRNQAVMSTPMQNVDGDVSQFDSMDIFQKIDYKRKLDYRISVLKQKHADELAAANSVKEKLRFDSAVSDAVSKLSVSSNQNNNES